VYRQNTIQLHGTLRSAFNKAMSGHNLIRIAFMPQQQTYLTYLLWITTLCMFGLIGVGYTFAVHVERPFLAGICLIPVFFVLAEMAIHRGVSAAFSDDDMVRDLSLQPWRLRRPIIRYAFMRELLRRHHKGHTVDELEDCLEFIQISRNGRPPGVTGFLRHPLVVALFTVSIYTISIRFIGTDPKNLWPSIASFLFIVSLLLWIGGVAYFLRYFDPSEEWHFECCIRWYSLEGRSERKVTTRAVA